MRMFEAPPFLRFLGVSSCCIGSMSEPGYTHSFEVLNYTTPLPIHPPIRHIVWSCVSVVDILYKQSIHTWRLVHRRTELATNHDPLTGEFSYAYIFGLYSYCAINFLCKSVTNPPFPGSNTLKQISATHVIKLGFAPKYYCPVSNTNIYIYLFTAEA
jgi:hypothetical protein